MPVAPKTRRFANGRKDRRKYDRHERGYGRDWHNERRTGAADIEFNRVITESGDPWCRICRREIATLMDHVVAPSTVGLPGSAAYIALHADKSNWQPACAACNRIKGNKPMSHPDVVALTPEGRQAEAARWSISDQPDSPTPDPGGGSEPRVRSSGTVRYPF